MTPALNAGIVREIYGGDAYRKGVSYQKSGAVTSLRWIGGVLEARVQGSRYEPYLVKITFFGDRPNRATCTCPLESGCKHVVAALLQYARSPGDVEEQAGLAELLAPLDRGQLESILTALVERNSDLYGDIVLQINLTRIKNLPADVKSLAPEPFQAAARAAFREARNGRDYDDYDNDEDDDEQARGLFFPLIEELEGLVKAGRANAALPALEAVTAEFAIAERGEDEYGSEGFWEDASNSLSDLWLHAALTVDLSREDRLEWSKRLSGWGRSLSDNELFDNAQEAFAHGWDDPILLQMLATGEGGPEADDWEGEEVYDRRITVLQEQGRLQEARNLALAVGNHKAACFAYVSLGQTAEAVSQAMAHLSDSRDILVVCQALQSAGAMDEALRLGDFGLTLPSSPGWGYYGATPRLSAWVRDAARAAGKPDLELRAAECAYNETPSLLDYDRIGVLSGERWPETKERLLRRLHEQYAPADAAVDIFLREERWDDALNAAEKTPYGATLGRAVRAVLTHIPNRAIDVAKRQAETIMNEAKASHYETAAQWLDCARAAYEASGRLSAWTEYLRSLLNLHSRKYKLVPMLRELA